MGSILAALGRYGLMGFGGLLVLGGIGLLADGDPDGLGSLVVGVMMVAGGFAWRVRRGKRAKLLAAGTAVLADVVREYVEDLVQALRGDRELLRELDVSMVQAGLPLARRDDVIRGVLRQVEEMAREGSSRQIVATVVMSEAAKAGDAADLAPTALRNRARAALAPVRSSMIGIYKAAARKAVADVARGEAELRSFWA
jgi:hypothetical protein